MGTFVKTKFYFLLIYGANKPSVYGEIYWGGGRTYIYQTVHIYQFHHKGNVLGETLNVAFGALKCVNRGVNCLI